MTMPLHFLWPQLLWLLWAVPLSLAGYLWLLRQRRQPALRYASLATVRQAWQPGRAWRRHLPPALLLLALAALLLASARPQAALPLPTDQATVVLAVDVSLSMQADDILPSRLDAARTAAKAFVRRLPEGVRVGVVSFAGDAHVVQPPTHSREALLAAIDRLHLQHGTAVGSGIELALAQLLPAAPGDQAVTERGPAVVLEPGSNPAAAIVLLTDGRSNFGTHPVHAADQAARLGVRIHAVGLGTDAEPEPSGSDDSWAAALQLDEATLREVTSLTRGEYFRAASAESLVQVYEHMGTRLQVRPRETELSAPLALGALLLLACAAGLSLAWCPRRI